MSIRLRLTLLYTAILALTLVAFSGILYAAQSRSTLKIVQDDLARDARQLAGGWVQLRRELGRMGPPWQSTDDPQHNHMMQLRALQPALRGMRSRDTLILLTTAGTPLDPSATEAIAALPISETGLASLVRGVPHSEIIRETEDERVFVYNQPVVFNGELIGIVQVARSLADRDRTLRSLAITLITGSALTALAAFGAGWILAGTTLRPIHQITQTAWEIGERRDFASRVQYRGPDDEIGRLAATFNRMLTRLQDAYQHVAHALQVQRDFVADVSHELRTPLTTIHGNLELLQRTPPPPEQDREDILNDLANESQRMIRLVSDLLTLARADAGRTLELAPVEVNPLVVEICRQGRLLAPEREIHCDVETQAPALVALANDDALKQVLLILVDNAIKHGQGAVRLGLSAVEDQVVISVEDSGPGMSTEQMESIFNRFYRGDTSRSTPGFGLGLSIARALVKAQQGTLDVESQVGHGSTFTVRLRCAVLPT